jgi:hypothetical protein
MAFDMTIRPAIASDKMHVIQLLRDFHAAAGYGDPHGPSGFHFPFDPAYADHLFREHLFLPDHVCLVYAPADVARGVLMAKVITFGDLKVAKESAWWIDRAQRGRAFAAMLDAYEAWAAAAGARFAGMAGLGDAPRVAALYRRRGYRPAETYYLKAL